MTIGMVTIIKNEEAVIERLLRNVDGFFDSYTIVDTGSTDSTLEILRDCLPFGEIHSRPWVNFGHNLTEAVQLAHNKSDWVMRLDADMTIRWHENFKDWLDSGATADAYNVMLHDGGINYRLPLLMNGHQWWKYVGATHEYLETTGRNVANVNGLDVFHAADGSNRDTKFQRDIELLKPAVEAGEDRAVFYTAESHYYAEDYETALEFYDRRVEMGGWEEETWFAQLKAGQCALMLGRPDAIPRLLDAHRRRPQRAEALKAIEDWCAGARPKTIPADDILFVDPNAYV